MLRVALDVQHLYKPKLRSSQGGTGAKAHPESDRGTRFVTAAGTVVWEAEAATTYAGACASYLRDRGAEVLTNDPVHGILTGSYGSRNRAAIAFHADVYIACHVNAGHGSYALTEFATGNPGYGLGNAIGAELWQVSERILNAKSQELKPGDRGLVCIREVPNWIAGVIVEPFFGDTLSMQPLLETPELVRIGEAIARGIVQWWQIADTHVA